MASKSTPMMEQYLAIKAEHPDAILFYRMGDFYEMFFEDAETASRALDIALTSRNKNDPNPVPMCGVPYRAVQGYLARLIEKGFKVAICDQVEDPAKAKGLVKRDVVRIVTPGMVVENEMLDARADNFLLAVVSDARGAGVSYLDISTGTFRLTESQDGEALVDEIQRVAAREILLPESARNAPEHGGVRDAVGGAALTYHADSAFEYGRARRLLMEQFGTLSLAGFGCEEHRLGIRAAGALLDYVKQTQKRNLVHVTGVETYSLDAFLILDTLSCQNLDLLRNGRTGRRQESLLGVIDRTVTAMGGRLLQHWLRYPLLDPTAIGDRQDAIADALRRIDVTRQVRTLLKSVSDIERLRGKISLGHANGRDLLALKGSLQTLPKMASLLARYQAPGMRLEVDLGALTELGDLLEGAIREDVPPTITEGGIFKEGYDADLDALIHLARDGKGVLTRLEVQEKQATGIGALKVRYNRVFGYYIEVPKNHADKVPLHYVRKQTLVNAERYITDELKAFETQVLGAEEQRALLEAELFEALRQRITARSDVLLAAAGHLARIDCLLALAEVAAENDYHRPVMTRDGRIIIEDGRHPVVERMAGSQRFVPNSIEMDNLENQVLIITGPNMAGKSTVLRQVALIVLMAQMGGFVPAKAATLSICDRIFTRVGALDNLAQGQSTFMVEMQETANILNHASADSLVIMDEIGRGTSTFDGLSIAWAVAEHLHDLKQVGVKTLFATHYHELTELARSRPRMKNYHITVKEWNDEIIFLRKLAQGGTNRSYGIQVARLAGIPAPVIQRAKKILYRIENGETLLGGVAPGDGTAAVQTRPTPVQMGLFQPAGGAAVVDALKAMDLQRMTPLEALNALSRLQAKLK